MALITRIQFINKQRKAVEVCASGHGFPEQVKSKHGHLVLIGRGDQVRLVIIKQWLKGFSHICCLPFNVSAATPFYVNSQLKPGQTSGFGVI